MSAHVTGYLSFFYFNNAQPLVSPSHMLVIRVFYSTVLKIYAEQILSS